MMFPKKHSKEAFLMNRLIRFLMLIACAVNAFLAVAFILKLPFVVQLWPLSYTNNMSFLFIGSIFGAAAASTLWSLLSREDGALAGGALDFVMICTPVSIFAFQLASRSRNNELTIFGIVMAAAAVLGLGLFLWSQRIPMRDPRPMPRLVRRSFMFFVVALVIAGGQMVLKVPNIIPWSITTDASVIYGWFFLGAAAYFTYGILRPSWANAAGQLAGFLVYDLILIVPFLTRLPEIEPRWRINLIVYTLVISLSALLAIYYLFINPATRVFARREAVPQVQTTMA
jgi:hypothetical protein